MLLISYVSFVHNLDIAAYSSYIGENIVFEARANSRSIDIPNEDAPVLQTS